MANVPAANISKQTHDELCCTYAALLLHDERLPVNAGNLLKVINASGNKVDSFWPNIFAKSLEGKDIIELLLGGGAPAQAGPVAAVGNAPAAKKEDAKPAKKEEKPKVEEEEAGGLGGLFD